VNRDVAMALRAAADRNDTSKTADFISFEFRCEVDAFPQRPLLSTVFF
jgi:hypothetical protein